MTKRIFRSIIAVALAVLIACFGLFLGVLYEYFGEIQAKQLKNELSFVSAGTEAMGMDYLEGLNNTDNRITWIDKNGKVLFDNRNDPAKMENHADREEIKEALSTGKGESSRYSSTMMEKTTYFANRLNDGSVLRVSISHMTILSLVLAMLQPIAIVILVAIILSWYLASKFSKEILKPLEAINYDEPIESETYDELAPVLTHMESQHREIKNKQKELEEKESEFSSIIRKMNEGLVLLSNKRDILSINPAAESFFETDGRSKGKNFIEIERTVEITDAIDKAEKEGYAEIQVSRKGREYILRISREEDANGGFVLLVFDNTERIFAERNRREFTANVSHELKTPLQTIMGSAELLQNNLVKKEDYYTFVERIQYESSRLLDMIEDIIRLSQLDEKKEISFEDVELLELVTNVAISLQNVADERGISIEVSGEKTVVYGVRQLLNEIVYNLCENAIKYNVDGGKVNITVGETFVTVKDTGIGISPEDQNHIFERFYRADKSHSREVDGSGLGLSIVKHAVEYMGGTISIYSEPEMGTEITVDFE
ncbi:MAG TPA: two-component sensor histidine kinase [Mogibacterium sp.]|nr:two-component sensor histidine kinase [Mogibacterium sp.]